MLNPLHLINRLFKLSIATIYYCVWIWPRNFIGGSNYNFVVLSYHEVTPKQRTRFVRQVEAILNYTRPRFIDCSVDVLTHRVAISFDDGFQNVLENALPYLQRYNIPCTLFIPTAYIGRHPAWITDPEHNNFCAPIISVEQLQELSPSLVEIGSHSCTHPDLSNLSPMELQRELQRSKHQLEEIVGKSVRLLACPYGKYNDEVLKAAAQSGYRGVLAADPVAGVNDFLWGRVTVSPDEWLVEFWLKVRGAYQWLPVAITCKYRLKKTLSNFASL